MQVEIVGTCDPATHRKWGSTTHLYTPDLPDWAIRDLAAFARWAHEQHGVPLTSGVAFKAYPGSYGSNGVRMGNAKWSSFRGHCGHQHVPENDHGDPGALPMAAILTAAAGTPAASTPHKENTNMQLNTEVPLGDWIPQQWPDDQGLKDKTIAVSTALGSTYGHARAAHDGIDELRAELADVKAQLAEALTLLRKEG